MTDKLSTIRAIHARYEAVNQEYCKIDDCLSGLSGNDVLTEKMRLRNALDASLAERDALRLAILRQVPDSWIDAMILTYHIYNVHDLIDGSEPDARTPGEKEALAIAIDTLFDFMACEVDANHEEIGPSFQESAIYAYQRRRLRTGVTDDI